MGEQLIDLSTGIVAAIIVMILHELPKTMIFFYMDKTVKKSYKSILQLYHYIDPIGLILCICVYGGFSKPYMYRIREKKVNKALGITGFVSLILIFLLNVVLLKHVFGVGVHDGLLGYPTSLNKISVILMQVCFNMAHISFGMALVNLFPIATFDMGNIIAGVSPEKFFEYLRKDHFVKLILLFALMMGLTVKLSGLMLYLLLG